MGKDKSTGYRYPVISEYVGSNEDLDGITEISTSPSWVIAVVRLGKPQTYSRRLRGSSGSVLEGAFSRKDKPLVIQDDCVHLNIQKTKKGHVKRMSAKLKHGGFNYLSRDVLLPGDWVMAWITNNERDAQDIANKAREGQGPLNDFMSGFKFLGRVHDVRKDLTITEDGKKDISYTLTASGFEEMDTQVFYDYALASEGVSEKNIGKTLAELGRDFNAFLNRHVTSGKKEDLVKDNSVLLISTLIDMIVGKGIDDKVTENAREYAKRVLKRNKQENGELQNTVDNSNLDLLSLQLTTANKEAPFSYLVPAMVGDLLGIDVLESTKGTGRRLLGYADLLQRQLGTQRYVPDPMGDPFLNFIPDVLSPLKGSYVPIELTFFNTPLWNILHQYLNDSINEMYMAIKPDTVGRLRPTVVARQIPFSTESIEESRDFPLTRFMSLPRWVIAPVMISNLSIGRSNATHINMVRVTGNAQDYVGKEDLTRQTLLNPPVFDEVDIQRSGIRGMVRKVDCFITDSKSSAPKSWMSAIADWAMGSHYTLNGRVQCVGIQAPIAEGDNCEIEGIVYHIESVVDECFVTPEGKKTFTTTLSLTNGMPADQSQANLDFPKYAGFSLRRKDSINLDSEINPFRAAQSEDQQSQFSDPPPDLYAYEDVESPENNETAESLDPGSTHEGTNDE